MCFSEERGERREEKRGEERRREGREEKRGKRGEERKERRRENEEKKKRRNEEKIKRGRGSKTTYNSRLCNFGVYLNMWFLWQSIIIIVVITFYRVSKIK
jgi:hypothetical protein